MSLAELIRKSKWKEALEYLLSHPDEVRLLSESLGRDFPDFVYRVAHNALLDGESPRKVYEAVSSLAPSETGRILSDIDDYIVNIMLKEPDRGLRLYRELGLDLPKSEALAAVVSDEKTRRLLSLVLEGDLEGAERIWENLSSSERDAFLRLFDAGVLNGKQDFLRAMNFYRELHAIESSKTPEEVVQHLERIAEILPRTRDIVRRIESLKNAKSPSDALAVLRSLPDGWRSIAGLYLLSISREKPGLINKDVIDELKKAGIDIRIVVPKIDTEDAFVAALYDRIVSLIRERRYDEAYLLLNKYRDVLSRHYVNLDNRKIPANEYLSLMLMYRKSGLDKLLAKLSNVKWEHLDRYTAVELESIRQWLAELLQHKEVLEAMKKAGLLGIDVDSLPRVLAAIEYVEGVKLLEKASKEKNPDRASVLVEKARMLLEDAYKYIPEAAIPLEEIQPSWEDIVCTLGKLGIRTSPTPIEAKIRRGML